MRKIKTLGMLLIEELSKPENRLFGEEHYKHTLNEMPNFKKSITGLAMNLWIEPKRDAHNASARLKFCRTTNEIKGISTGDYIPISICDEPKILVRNHPKITITQSQFEQLQRWIVANKIALLKYYNKEIDLPTLVSLIVKVK